MKPIKIFVVLLFICQTLFAQKDTSNKKYGFGLWGNIGGMYSFAKNASGDNFYRLLGYDYGLNASFNKRHYIFLRRYKMDDFKGFSFSSPKPHILQKLENYNLMYGWGESQSKNFATIFATGVSYGNGVYRGKQIGVKHGGGGWFAFDTPIFEMDTFQYFGVPLQMTLLFSSPIYGLSLDFYVNFHKYTDFGFVLNSNFGSIRKE